MIRNKSGFTMTELMVVLGIIAIASAIAVPNFNRDLQ
jgi:prepilin-type N-terminal cleavage/methylation domain-containing protein